MRYQLAGLQFIDVQTLGFDEAVHQLVETVREHLAKFGPVEEPETRQAELVIQGVDPSAFTADKQAQLLDFIARLTSADRSQLQIADLTSGSVHVFVEMPARAAFALKTRALNRDERFKQLGIVSLRLDGDAKYVNTASGALTLAATTSPLRALLLKIPTLLAPMVSLPVGKMLTIVLGAVFIVGAAFALSQFPGRGGSSQHPAATDAPLSTPTVPPSPTQTASPEPTLAATQTETATSTITQTATFMPTETDTPSLTPAPTIAILQGEIINRIACRHGPGDIYLYEAGLIPGTRMDVRGRVDLQRGRLGETWLWGLPAGVSNECWVHARDVKLAGDPASLDVIYPDRVDLPFLREPRWPAPQNVEAARQRDEVTIRWDFFDVPLSERESENSPRYVLEVWLCQDGRLTFTPLPVYEDTKISVSDQAGCNEPSRGRIVLAEKHGYVGPVEIEWPPYP
jgi:hypothetical protein